MSDKKDQAQALLKEAWRLKEEDWGKITQLGVDAIEPLVHSLKESPGMTWEILNTLSQIDGDRFQQEALRIMKQGGSGRRDAYKLLNRDRSHQDNYILCPRCDTYLGIRKELLTKGSRITQEMKNRASAMRTEIIADGYYPCPECGAQVLL